MEQRDLQAEAVQLEAVQLKCLDRSGEKGERHAEKQRSSSVSMVATVALEGSCPEGTGSGASRPVVGEVCTQPELQSELVSAKSAMRETFQGSLRSVKRVADWVLPNSSRVLIAGTRCCTRVLLR